MTTISAPDRLAIERLYGEYNHAIHRGDGEAWAACFTRDGVFSNRAESVTGRAALSAYASEFSRNRDRRYWIGNLVLESSAEGVSSTCYLIILAIASGSQAPRISLTGIYTDDLVRNHSSWLFARRHIERDL